MSLQAFLARHVITNEGIRPAAVLVGGERVQAVVAPDQIPVGCTINDFGDAAILPGLVDSHVHINEPGRGDWEGFETATRAAAAGGCTMLVDMPLNCLPSTTTDAALAAKRKAARGKCRVDWAAWGGLVHDNQNEIEDLATAGVLGFKCFLVDPGIDSFTMVSEQELRSALPRVARTGLPLLVHAELPGPIDRATDALANADWSCYGTYLDSRPDEAELAAIRMMLTLCREFGFRLHIVHLSTSQALQELADARKEGLPVSVETCPHYLHLSAEQIHDGATSSKCAPPIRGRDNCERLWQGLRDRTIDFVVTDHSPCPPAMKRLGEGNFRSAWGGEPFCGASNHVDGSQQTRIHASRCCPVDVRWACPPGGVRPAQGPHCSRLRCGFRGIRTGSRDHCDGRQTALPAPSLTLSGGNTARESKGYLSTREPSVR